MNPHHNPSQLTPIQEPLLKSKLYLSAYKSKFGSTNYNNDDEMDKKTTENKLDTGNTKSFEIGNPVIAAIGIGNYDKGIFPNLDCVSTDYKNIQHAFNIVRGYDIVYYSNKNNIVHKRGSNYNDSDNSYNTDSTKWPQFKLQWTEKEIFEFNDKLDKIVNSSRYNYDCLIYFVSSHGDCDGIIYDSKGNKIPLIAIFDKFNNHKCFQLRNKPKIYFVDACRGSRRTKNYNNSMYKAKMTSEVNVTTNNETDESNDNKFCDEEKQEYADSSAVNIIANTRASFKDKNNNNKNYTNVFSKCNFNREIYANTEGFAVVEPGSRGAYMTRSITKCIENDSIFEKDFDSIMIHCRKIMLKLMGMSPDCGAQVIDEHNNIPRQLVFTNNKYSMKK